MKTLELDEYGVKTVRFVLEERMMFLEDELEHYSKEKNRKGRRFEFFSKNEECFKSDVSKCKEILAKL